MAWSIDEFDEELEEENGLRVVRLKKLTRYSAHEIFCDYDSEGRVKPYEHHRFYSSVGSAIESEFDECEEYISDLGKIKIPKFILGEIRKFAQSQEWKRLNALRQ